MALYTYGWMFAVLLLFLISMYAMYSRDLFQPRPLIALAFATGLAYWVRVQAYVLFMRIARFNELDLPFLFAMLIVGALFLVGLCFVFLTFINCVFPRTLGMKEMLYMAAFSGFFVTLILFLYGMAQTLGKEFGFFGA